MQPCAMRRMLKMLSLAILAVLLVILRLGWILVKGRHPIHYEG